MIRTLVYFIGAAAEGLALLRPRLGWRAWQMWRRWLINARDVAVLLVTVAAWWFAIHLWGA